jgi:hypothetical protein
MIEIPQLYSEKSLFYLLQITVNPRTLISMEEEIMKVSRNKLLR